MINALFLAGGSVSGVGAGWEWFPVFRIIACIFILVCALFVIAVVMIQPSNSAGIGAINGQSETFLSKNKGKTFESKMKKLTVVASIVLAVCCIFLVILTYVAGLNA